MATMPNLLNFSMDYANIALSALGVVPSITYQTVSPPFKTPGVITAQSPAGGQTISGPVTLTVIGGFTYPGTGVTVFSQPFNLVSPIVGP